MISDTRVFFPSGTMDITMLFSTRLVSGELGWAWASGMVYRFPTLVLFILYFLYLRHAHTHTHVQCAARSHSRFTFKLTIRVLSSSLLNLFHCTIYCVTARVTMKNYRFFLQKIGYLWTVRRSQFYTIPI